MEFVFLLFKELCAGGQRAAASEVQQAPALHTLVRVALIPPHMGWVNMRESFPCFPYTDLSALHTFLPALCTQSKSGLGSLHREFQTANECRSLSVNENLKCTETAHSVINCGDEIGHLERTVPMQPRLRQGHG